MSRPSRVIRIAAAVLGALGCATASQAASLSFAGTLANDNSVLVYGFMVTATSGVSIETFSYAGGTNYTGQVVAAGGFDPVFSVFTAAGALVDTGDDGATRTDPANGAAFDAVLTKTLNAGSYFVAVSQWDNFAIGPAYANGYIESASANFTSAYGCSAGRFCDVNGFSRTANLAISITGTAVSAVPEPAPAALLLLALPLLPLARRLQRRA